MPLTVCHINTVIRRGDRDVVQKRALDRAENGTIRSCSELQRATHYTATTQPLASELAFTFLRVGKIESRFNWSF